ncbi:hypothetical protein IWQ60_000090 [Tieghemiomyces parasiticus]|uniref:Uncharacterized protein n=1 Tax=Tieghemiomyces parasiticus TaxID=78921 RepID=A0A9W8AMD5_9FUNG|nr:hypothetical protein IWQ60_000090 [Tieghemiomyces parasiticus]
MSTTDLFAVSHSATLDALYQTFFLLFFLSLAWSFGRLRATADVARLSPFSMLHTRDVRTAITYVVLLSQVLLFSSSLVAFFLTHLKPYTDEKPFDPRLTASTSLLQSMLYADFRSVGLWVSLILYNVGMGSFLLCMFVFSSQWVSVVNFTLGEEFIPASRGGFVQYLVGLIFLFVGIILTAWSCVSLHWAAARSATRLVFAIQCLILAGYGSWAVRQIRRTLRLRRVQISALTSVSAIIRMQQLEFLVEYAVYFVIFVGLYGACFFMIDVDNLAGAYNIGGSYFASNVLNFMGWVSTAAMFPIMLLLLFPRPYVTLLIMLTLLTDDSIGLDPALHLMNQQERTISHVSTILENIITSRARSERQSIGFSTFMRNSIALPLDELTRKQMLNASLSRIIDGFNPVDTLPTLPSQSPTSLTFSSRIRHSFRSARSRTSQSSTDGRPALTRSGSNLNGTGPAAIPPVPPLPLIQRAPGSLTSNPSTPFLPNFSRSIGPHSLAAFHRQQSEQLPPIPDNSHILMNPDEIEKVILESASQADRVIQHTVKARSALPPTLPLGELNANLQRSTTYKSSRGSPGPSKSNGSLPLRDRTFSQSQRDRTFSQSQRDRAFSQSRHDRPLSQVNRDRVPSVVHHDTAPPPVTVQPKLSSSSASKLTTSRLERTRPQALDLRPVSQVHVNLSVTSPLDDPTAVLAPETTQASPIVAASLMSFVSQRESRRKRLPSLPVVTDPPATRSIGSSSGVPPPATTTSAHPSERDPSRAAYPPDRLESPTTPSGKDQEFRPQPLHPISLLPAAIAPPLSAVFKYPLSAPGDPSPPLLSTESTVKSSQASGPLLEVEPSMARPTNHCTANQPRSLAALPSQSLLPPSPLPLSSCASSATRPIDLSFVPEVDFFCIPEVAPLTPPPAHLPPPIPLLRRGSFTDCYDLRRPSQYSYAHAYTYPMPKDLSHLTTAMLYGESVSSTLRSEAAYDSFIQPELMRRRGTFSGRSPLWSRETLVSPSRVPRGSPPTTFAAAFPEPVKDPVDDLLMEDADAALQAFPQPPGTRHYPQVLASVGLCLPTPAFPRPTCVENDSSSTLYASRELLHLPFGSSTDLRRSHSIGPLSPPSRSARSLSHSVVAAAARAVEGRARGLGMSSVVDLARSALGIDPAVTLKVPQPRYSMGHVPAVKGITAPLEPLYHPLSVSDFRPSPIDSRSTSQTSNFSSEFSLVDNQVSLSRNPSRKRRLRFKGSLEHKALRTGGEIPPLPHGDFDHRLRFSPTVDRKRQIHVLPPTKFTPQYPARLRSVTSASQSPSSETTNEHPGSGTSSPGSTHHGQYRRRTVNHKTSTMEFRLSRRPLPAAPNFDFTTVTAGPPTSSRGSSVRSRSPLENQMGSPPRSARSSGSSDFPDVSPNTSAASLSPLSLPSPSSSLFSGSDFYTSMLAHTESIGSLASFLSPGHHHHISVGNGAGGSNGHSGGDHVAIERTVSPQNLCTLNHLQDTIYSFAESHRSVPSNGNLSHPRSSRTVSLQPDTRYQQSGLSNASAANHSTTATSNGAANLPAYLFHPLPLPPLQAVISGGPPITSRTPSISSVTVYPPLHLDPTSFSYWTNTESQLRRPKTFLPPKKSQSRQAWGPARRSHQELPFRRPWSFNK